MTFVTIDLSLIVSASFIKLAFFTYSIYRYLLFDSTVVNNYKSLHLVNNKALLKPKSFVPLTSEDKIVHVGITMFLIWGRSTRVIKKVFIGLSGLKTLDIALTDVAVVERFYTNIISEAKLAEKGIWYCGADCLLRIKKIKNNNKVA